ncbi:MAG: DUF58 domain-containing protein [Gorillibacterium sp.]|nr:DUF58 domain-containing protein [Gorillibacterium sp.]
MIIPTTRMAWITSGGAILVFIGLIAGVGIGMLLLVNAVLLGLSALDITLLPRRRNLTISRKLPDRADKGERFQIQIRAEANQPVHLKLELADDLPGSFAKPQESMHIHWRGKFVEFTYTTLGSERGEYHFGLLSLRLHGSLGLWAKRVQVETDQSIRIYPDLSGVRGVLSTTQNHLTLEGKRIYRKQTSGSEFHAIREYVTDDDPRQINWRAAARTGTLMTNVFRPERGKVVTILLDCGRMMGVELDGRNKLDVALEAALALAAVALKQGDKVGFLAYSSRIKVYVPPGAGLSHLSVITDAIYNLTSDFVEASCVYALGYLMRVQRKRSLIVLFTDINPYMQEAGLLLLLSRLRKQHYLLLLGIRDEVIHGHTLMESKHSRDAYIKSLSHKFMLDRQAYTAEMTRNGISVIDVPAGQLAWIAVNRYLDVKANDVL